MLLDFCTENMSRLLSQQWKVHPLQMMRAHRSSSPRFGKTVAENTEETHSELSVSSSFRKEWFPKSNSGSFCIKVCDPLQVLESAVILMKETVKQALGVDK